MTRSIAFTLLLASVTLAGNTAERPAKKPTKESSAKAATKPQTLWGIRWYPSLQSAQKVAAKKGRTPRLVLWMRVLGDLKGKT